MLNTKAFSGTSISVDKSMAEIDKLLTKYGVRENRYTHSRPERVGAPGELGKGALVYEFVWPERGEQARRGVRIKVEYREVVGVRGGRAGITAEQAGRALFWHIKSKFDSVEFGIESFDVAFMPYLRTALADGGTLAENQHLIGEFTAKPLAIGSLLALPAPRGGEVNDA
jgi:hypothetical protein